MLRCTSIPLKFLVCVHSDDVVSSFNFSRKIDCCVDTSTFADEDMSSLRDFLEGLRTSV